MIKVTDLHKSYGSVKAVDGVTFGVQRGETFGLLGPNGAGKTTTIHMLVGALRPDGGNIEINGLADPTRVEARRQIGIAPQALALYDMLTGEENLAFFARLYGLSGADLKERVGRALQLAGLEERRGHRVGTYSGGMKRRLNLACALIHDPPVLLLDEPTVGVDPQSRNHLFDTIEALADQGRTIIYTTHYMEEAQRLCDRVAIMEQGRLLALDTVEGLIGRHGGQSVVELDLQELPAGAAELPGRLEGTVLRVQTDRPFEEAMRLASSGLKCGDVRIHRPDLETVFLNLTGRSLRD